MINHAWDVVPEPLFSVLRQLGKTDWIDIEHLGNGRDFKVKFKPEVPLAVQNWLAQFCASGADYLSMHASSKWIAHGPKIFRPSLRNLEAAANIKVKINPLEYKQRYPALLIELPKEFAPPFESVLCCHQPEFEVIVMCLHSKNHLNDITNAIRLSIETDMEEVINRYYDDIAQAEAGPATRCLRAAINLNLLMVNFFSTQSEPLNKHEFANNRRLIERGGEVGERARERASGDLRLVTFRQEVKLYSESKPKGEYKGGTHGSPHPHWRSGHIRRQVCGPKRTERKLVFIKPVMVLAEFFAGDEADTEVVYEMKERTNDQAQDQTKAVREQQST